MPVTHRRSRPRRSAIATMALVATASILLPTACGSDAEVGTPDPDAPAATVDEQPAPASDGTATDETTAEQLNDQLIDAVRAGEVDEVQALLDAGADVDATGFATSGSWSYTEAPAITHAVLTGHTDVLELLIANGADLEKAELGYRDTALHTAAHLDDAEAVHILLGHGANPKPISEHWNWETPLHYAAEAGALKAIDALLDDGVEVDVQVGGRRTALMNVVMEGSPAVATEVAAILLDRGADPNLADNSGRTTLHSAAARGNTEVVVLCIEHGAEIDRPDDHGDTALHLAAQHIRPDAVVALVDAGASLEITNNDGETPADVASHDEIADLLRR